ncbi:protein suppressor of npr1-1 constitutive 4 [Quercus suber]|uniref:Protein suppressor of npr1-1 constitutive 4 n=1 Tax=Quercus suber TaxID=58331 RepID=A0AAW0IQA1_QUESU
MSFHAGLVTIDIAKNDFVGSIPSWIGHRLSSLVILNLRSINFQGYIPEELYSLTSLQILDLSHNKLFGSMPRCVHNFSAMATNLWSLLKNLKFVKTFASVNLVLKAYLWHVDETDYLPGHEEELEDFANDVPLSVSYSYDPVTQFLNYIDNGNFSINGVLADIPLILHQRL